MGNTCSFHTLCLTGSDQYKPTPDVQVQQQSRAVLVVVVCTNETVAVSQIHSTLKQTRYDILYCPHGENGFGLVKLHTLQIINK